MITGRGGTNQGSYRRLASTRRLIGQRLPSPSPISRNKFLLSPLDAAKSGATTTTTGRHSAPVAVVGRREPRRTCSPGKHCVRPKLETVRSATGATARHGSGAGSDTDRFFPVQPRCRRRCRAIDVLGVTTRDHQRASGSWIQLLGRVIVSGHRMDVIPSTRLIEHQLENQLVLKW